MVHLVLLALKLAMLIDALNRRASVCWAFAIVLVPFGEVAYFGIVVLPEILPARRRIPKARRQSPSELRYLARENPCHENRVLLAERLFEAGEFRESRDGWQALLSEVPDDRRALYGLARCHLAHGDPDAAIVALERLVSLRRAFEDYGAWRMLAETLSERGRHPEALASLERLVKTAPRLLHQLTLAQAQDRAGETAAARNTLEAALEDHHHAPRFIQREAKQPARLATALLGRLEPS